jgi:hypothetical protein
MGREKRQDTSTLQTAGVTDCDCDRYQRRNSARTDAVTEERQRTSERAAFHAMGELPSATQPMYGSHIK